MKKGKKEIEPKRLCVFHDRSNNTFKTMYCLLGYTSQQYPHIHFIFLPAAVTLTTGGMVTGLTGKHFTKNFLVRPAQRRINIRKLEDLDNSRMNSGRKLFEQNRLKTTTHCWGHLLWTTETSRVNYP